MFFSEPKEVSDEELKWCRMHDRQCLEFCRRKNFTKYEVNSSTCTCDNTDGDE